jgi:type I restriction enzyme S subunit
MNTKQLRQKILDLAIRGKLVPQDPNDEPASVLLERVRAEKELLIKEGKIKRDKSAPASTDKSHYGQLPPGWEWCQFSCLATFSGGKTPLTENADYWNGSINWVTSKDMKSKDIHSTQVKMSELGAMQMQIFEPDTLLVVVRSGILRRTLPLAILRKSSTVNQDIKTASFYLSELCEYIYYYLSATEQEILTKYKKNGTTVESINFDELKDIVIPIPPLAEQRRIVEAIEAVFALIDEIERSKADLQTAVAAAKSRILSLAIRGKLVPQDPADEPASALLERIWAEKEKLGGTGGGKRKKGGDGDAASRDNSYYTVFHHTRYPQIAQNK